VASDYTEGGQSDAMFLLVVNSKTQSFSVVSINRNTMTDIALCDADGNDLGTISAQICLQHAFGDGKRLSCIRTVDVVEKLFGNIPISGYLAMNMGGIPQMNDAVGGVTLTALHDVSFPDQGVDLREGETVTLNGTQAYYYLHGRDTDEYDSATKRLRREEQYITAYMEKLKELAQGDASCVVGVYDEIDDYLVTSVDFASLITELLDYDFSEDEMYTVPGETRMGEPIGGTSYEEYYVDEDALQALIMQVFYEPAEQSE
jgi:LCP family protein required for cell wall assembly